MARRARNEGAESRADSRDRIASLASVVGKNLAFRPARQVMKVVRAVPTILPDIDRKLRVGGWPIERLATIHGPTSEGKTSFVHALGLSFLMRGHFYVHIDSERTTPITWMEGLFGPYADSPLFLGYRPPTYEEAVDAVRDFANKLADARAKNKVPKDSTALIVVDSLRKLVPKDFMKRIAREGENASAKKGVDMLGGMGAAIKAKMNSSWIDELTPLLDDTMTAMIFIGREMENADATNDWDPDYKLGGGKGVEFDSSITGRITASWVYGSGKKDEKKRPVFGERHDVAIRKTKVAGKEEKIIHSFFHTSNGAIVPAGFDRARDVVEIARDLEIMKGDGGTLTWDRQRWKGENNAVKFFTLHPTKLAALEECCRARFEVEGGDKVDGDGVVAR